MILQEYAQCITVVQGFCAQSPQSLSRATGIDGVSPSWLVWYFFILGRASHKKISVRFLIIVMILCVLDPIKVCLKIFSLLI